jgi:hypothetical protein
LGSRIKVLDALAMSPPLPSVRSRRPQTWRLTTPKLRFSLASPFRTMSEASILPFWKLQLGSTRILGGTQPLRRMSTSNGIFAYAGRLICLSPESFYPGSEAWWNAMRVRRFTPSHLKREREPENSTVAEATGAFLFASWRAVARRRLRVSQSRVSCRQQLFLCGEFLARIASIDEGSKIYPR